MYLHSIFGSYNNATIAPKHFDRRVDSQDLQRRIHESKYLATGVSTGSLETKPGFYHWSSNYQCLPSEVEFLEGSGTEVQITSYINNLHPAHKGIYQAIEKLVSLAIT